MFVPDPGSDFFAIPNLGSKFFHPRSASKNSEFFYPGSRIRIKEFRIFPSRIRIKEFKYFYPKKRFLSSRKYDPGWSSRIRIYTFYPSRISDAEVKKAPDPGPGSGSATLLTNKLISKSSFSSRKDSGILQKPRWSSDKQTTARMVSATTRWHKKK